MHRENIILRCRLFDRSGDRFSVNPAGAAVIAYNPTIEEERALAAAISAARQIQTFLWGEANEKWGLEEWLRMFRKRVSKLEDINRENPHASVELKKRLLQTAALSIALLGIIDRDGVPWDAAAEAPPSNLPAFGARINVLAPPADTEQT